MAYLSEAEVHGVADRIVTEVVASLLGEGK
jgi:hypothetical protein